MKDWQRKSRGPGSGSALPGSKSSCTGWCTWDLCLIGWLYIPPKADALYLAEAFSRGFHTPYEVERKHTTARHLKSVYGMEEVVRKKIELGHISGLHKHLSLKSLRISPLGIVPKKVQGEFRFIHYLSYRYGDSENDAIDPQLCTVRYASFDVAVEMIKEPGPAALLAKCDVTSAFRLFPVHPEGFDLLGFMCKGANYFDKSMPIGGSIPCAAFAVVCSL